MIGVFYNHYLSSNVIGLIGILFCLGLARRGVCAAAKAGWCQKNTTYHVNKKQNLET